MAAQPMFPLQSALLPGEVLPLRIFEPRYSELVQDCLAMTDPAFGVVLITRGREVGGGLIRSGLLGGRLFASGLFGRRLFRGRLLA